MEYAYNAAVNMGTIKDGIGAFYKVTAEGIEKAREWEKQYGGKITSKDPTVYGRDWYVNSAGQKVGLRTYNAYDYMIRDAAPTQTHNLSVNGRSGNTTYNIGLGYLDQSGMNKVAKHDDFKRYNASIRLSTQFNKYVSINAGAIYSKRVKRYPYTTQAAYDPWYYLYRWGPQYPIGYDELGQELRSPVSEYRQANTAEQEKNYTNINIGLHLDITKNWTVDFDFTNANEEYNWLRPGIRFEGANTWTGASQRRDGNGNLVYVNSNGDVVSSTASGAMIAYDLPYQVYTGIGSSPDNVNRRSTNSKRNTINAYTTYNLQMGNLHNFKFMAGVNRVAYIDQYHQG